MKKIFIGIVLIISTFTLKSQVLNDYIIKLNNDTIRCNITVIDENYIFYNYFNSNQKYKKTYISWDDVKSYEKKNDNNNYVKPIRDTTYYPPITKYMSLGVGAGLNYGGFGTCSTVSIKYAELFIGVGYNLLQLGFNGGLLFRTLPNKKICPYIGGMYGYNATIIINNAKEYNKTYFGPSFCIGFEIFTKKRNKYFNFTFIVPVRTWDYYNDLTNIQHNPNIVLYNEPLPFTVSLGFHFL